MLYWIVLLNFKIFSDRDIRNSVLSKMEARPESGHKSQEKNLRVGVLEAGGLCKLSGSRMTTASSPPSWEKMSRCVAGPLKPNSSAGPQLGFSCVRIHSCSPVTNGTPRYATEPVSPSIYLSALLYLSSPQRLLSLGKQVRHSLWNWRLLFRLVNSF